MPRRSRMPGRPRPPSYAQLIKQLQQCGPESILRAASLCDGHAILKPEALTDAGLPPAVVQHLTRTYHSDGSPKGTIYVDGRAVKMLAGVYGLDALRFLAAGLGVDYRPAIGRGSEAANIQAALRQHLSAKPGTDAASPNSG